MSGSIRQERILALLSGFFACLALSLAALGLYGVTSYAVRHRQAELAIRMAVGGSARGVIWLIVRQVAGFLTIGVAVGALLSWWVTGHIAPTLLYGVESRDGATLAAAAVVLVAVGLLAGWLPARRAARIDPAQVLRET